MANNGYACLCNGFDRRRDLRAAFEFNCLRSAFTHQTSNTLQSSVQAAVVSQEGHVSDDKRIRSTTYRSTCVIDHVIQRNR
ncbi:hypothetical protein D3C71_1843660 [compost metagenome]